MTTTRLNVLWVVICSGVSMLAGCATTTLEERLHAAVRAGDAAQVTSTLVSDIGIETPEKATGMRPLHLAAKNLDVNMAEKLLSLGASVTATNPLNGATALHYACLSSGERDARAARMIELLIRKGASVDSVAVSPLRISLWASTLPSPDLQNPDHEGELVPREYAWLGRSVLDITPLHVAAMRNGQLAAIALLKHNAKVDAELQCTPIAGKRKVALTTLDLAATGEVDTSASSISGLQYLSVRRRPRSAIVSILLQNGAKKDEVASKLLAENERLANGSVDMTIQGPGFMDVIMGGAVGGVTESTMMEGK